MALITIRQLAVYTVDGLESGAEIGAVSKRIAAMLIETHRGSDVEKFERAVIRELERRGMTQVTITSALPLGKSTRMRIADSLGVKTPLFREVIDETVVGGVRAETSELLLDMTTSRKLSRFVQEVGRQ